MAFKVLSRIVAFKNELFFELKKQMPNEVSLKLPILEDAARAFRYKIGRLDRNGKDGRDVLSLCDAKSVADITFFPDEVLESDGRLMELFEAWMAENGKWYFTEKEKLRRFEHFQEKVFEIHRDMAFIKRRLNKMADLSRSEYDEIPSS